MLKKLNRYLQKHRIPKDVLSGNIYQQMLLFFFPVFMSYLLQQIYGFADSMILGRFVGKQGLASVGGSATAIINVILNFIAGMNSAVTVLVAQNVGRRNDEKVNSVIKTGFYIAVLLGGLIGIVMLVSSPLLLDLMKQPAESRGNSLIYLRFYSVALIPYFIYQTGLSVMRALGDSKRPVYFILIIAITKILFDLLFAGIFKLGVFGTSLATFLSYLICAIAILFVFRHTPDIYGYDYKKDFGYDKDELNNILNIGVPFALQSVTFALPGTIMQSKINEFGTDTIAAYSAYNNVDNLFWCYANTISTSTITMTGQNYGAGKYRRVRRIALCAALIEGCGALFFGIMFRLFGYGLLKLFSTDPSVLEIGFALLKRTSSLYVLYLFVGTISSACKGCGMAKAPMVIALFSILLFRVAYLFTVTFHSPTDVVFCLPLSWALTSVLSALYFFTNPKLKKDPL
ncbi:MAG: MATE family efflux transporter [Erysipelotrichaceae bacterium]|nr:MATE family efflux transporter [Erysipelotrichaceae bacterium]